MDGMRRARAAPRCTRRPPSRRATASAVALAMLIAERPDALQRLLRAAGQSTQRIKTDPAFTMDVLRRFTDVDDPDALDEGYRTAVAVLREVPTPTRGGIQALIDEVAYSQPAIRDADPERFYDATLVQRLEAEGFYRQLYGH